MIAAVAATTASAITDGEADGNRHPNVGALVADWNPDSPGPDQFCTGTLVTSTLFLTSSHCMTGWEPGTQFCVTISPTYEEGSASPGGLVPVSSFVTHEKFGSAGRRGRRLRHRDGDARDTAVGDARAAADARSAEHLQARLAVQQSLNSLKPTWLNLSMNPSTGNGGTCYGDSGGPHFLGGMTSNLIVSLTVTGDAGVPSDRPDVSTSWRGGRCRPSTSQGVSASPSQVV